ncbi:Probable cyclic nucleotide-gated ion channel 20, chloroplastic [Ancistrocladus abbreviatus]
MDVDEKDEIPMLSDTHSQILDEHYGSQFQRSALWTRSASMSIPVNYIPSYDENNLVGHTGPLRSARKASFIQMSGPLYIGRKPQDSYKPLQGVLQQNAKEPLADTLLTYRGMDKNEWPEDNHAERNEHLMRSGQLGMCNDPYCTTCPSSYNYKAGKYRRTSDIFDNTFHNALYGDAKGWARRFCSFLQSYVPGVMNPHTKVVQQWNKFFVISCLVAIFVDPLFFFVLSILREYNCIVIDWPIATTIVIFRSITDIIYFLHILLQFRLAYVAPESRVVGAGDLVDHPKRIALHYLTGYFLIDIFAVLPLPQIMILMILPRYLSSSGANFAKNLIRAAVLAQYMPRLYRFLPLLIGQSPSGFVFESAWSNFVINLLTFVLAGHVVGSGWYLFGLQRVNQCLRDACHDSGILSCPTLLDCGDEDPRKYKHDHGWSNWASNANASACFDSGGNFTYGIYQYAVKLTTVRSFADRYVYSLFWGFQQISTLAGNQVPSYFGWEVLFTMAIIGLGLLLFALLIGNMQNFLQSLGRRRLEMSLRCRDVEQWMSHRRLPEELRRKVREAERYNWAATRGVNEEMLMENLPEDLQREIRRHLFKFIKKVRIFALMEEPILDTIRERLRQKTYIMGSRILDRGGVIDKMVFIVRGKLESIGEDGIILPLSEGDVCGEELLTWCLEQSSSYRGIKSF